MTLEELIAINRTAEKIAKMGMAPPGHEARELAEDMFEVMCAARQTLREQFPRHANDGMAGNAVVLRAIVKALPVIDAAQEFATVNAARVFPPNSATSKLIAAVRNYNLIQTPPQPLTEDEDHEQRDPH